MELISPFDPYAGARESISRARLRIDRIIDELRRSGDPNADWLIGQLEDQKSGINLSSTGYTDPLAQARSELARRSGNDFARFNEQSAFDETQARGRELIGQTKGLYEQAMSDPTDRFIMDRLKEMADPRQVQDALFTQGADQATAAGAARWNQQQESLAMRGLTPQSGAYQAAQNQNMAQRQQDVQRARLQSTLAGTQQAGQALSQLGSQQQASFGRKQSSMDRYGEALKTPVGVRPEGAGTGAGQPNINQGTGATFKPVSYSDFQKEWAKANAPKPPSPFGRF